MTECGFWWASIDGRETEVVHVSAISFDHKVAYATGLDVDIELDKVRLIERVLPPGRATPAALHGALVAAGWNDAGYVSLLQGCEETDEAGETVGHTTLIDGYFDLAKAAEILAAGGDAA